MSLSWRDRILIYLAPAEVSWVRVRGALKNTVCDKGAIEVDPGYGAEPWQGAVAALQSAAEAWQKDKVAITIVLSNHFVRYLLMPAGEGTRDMEEACELARFHFAKVHGERSRDWDVRVGDPRTRTPQIVSAIDATLMPALRACFPRESQARLVSVQPFLMSALNRWHRHFPKAGAWFLLLEQERACLALLAEGGWITVQNAKGAYESAEDCTGLVDRERWRLDLEKIPENVLVHTPQPSMPLVHEGTWRHLISQSFWPAGIALPEDWRYAAALTAL